MKSPPKAGQAFDGSVIGRKRYQFTFFVTIRPRRTIIRLFRRLEEGRGTGTELLGQRLFLGFGDGERALLDWSKAANFFRDRCNRHRRRMIERRQLGQDRL